MNSIKLFVAMAVCMPALGLADDSGTMSNSGTVIKGEVSPEKNRVPVVNRPLLVGPDQAVPDVNESGKIQFVKSPDAASGNDNYGGAVSAASGVSGNQTASSGPDFSEVLRSIETSMKAGGLTRQQGPIISKSLPGMAPDKSRPITVTALPGVNEMVDVSLLLPNRIATPFKEPKVVDLSDSTIQTLGSNVFVLPKDANPVGLFITEKNDGGVSNQVISLTLVPKKIPGQNILVTIDGLDSTNAALPEEKQVGEAGDYVDGIRHIMRSVLRGVAPDGYVSEKMSFNKANMAGIEASALYRYSGSILDVFQYKLRNQTNVPVSLTEQSFYQQGVKAVTFYPKVHLLPGQDTNVFILAAKQVMTSRNGGVE